MLWVVQNNVHSEEGHARLMEALRHRSLPHVECKIIPFGGGLHPEPEVDGPVVVVGTYSMVEIARERGWRPGSFANDNHDFRAQLPRWGDRMLNAGARIVRFGDVSKTRQPFFVRPVEDGKAFAGHVSSWGQYLRWREDVLAGANGTVVTLDTPVMLCPVREIAREWRLWVVDGRVVTDSLYKEGRVPRSAAGAPSEVLQFAGEVMRSWEPARAYCLDVAELAAGDLKVIEVNCVNASGFYAADVGALVDAIEDMRFGDGG